MNISIERTLPHTVVDKQVAWVSSDITLGHRPQMGQSQGQGFLRESHLSVVALSLRMLHHSPEPSTHQSLFIHP